MAFNYVEKRAQSRSEKRPGNRTGKKSIQYSSRTRLLLILLVVGAIGSLVTGALLYFSPAETAEAVARHKQGLFTNLYDMFVMPVLLMFIVMLAYAITELYKIYQKLHDPEFYRARRRQNPSGKRTA